MTDDALIMLFKYYFARTYGVMSINVTTINIHINIVNVNNGLLQCVYCQCVCVIMYSNVKYSV